MKILYVENHAVFAANVIKSFLKNHEVTVVPSLGKARNALRQDKFDLLMVDYDLDDGKGATLVSEVYFSQNKIPIIGCSSHEDGNSELRNAGADAICPWFFNLFSDSKSGWRSMARPTLLHPPSTKSRWHGLCYGWRVGFNLFLMIT